MRSVGHVGCLCLLEDAERVFGHSSAEAAAAEPANSVSLPGDGSFTHGDVRVGLRKTGNHF